MPDNSNRNMILFVILAGLIFFGYEFLFIQPQAERDAAVARARAAAVAKAGPAAAAPGMPGIDAPIAFLPRDQALAADPRIAIKTPALAGSISLRGGRFDDLYLTGYRETLAKNSPPVELFRPQRAQAAYFAQLSWTGANLTGLPGSDTLWTVQGNNTLAPAAPVTLTYTSPQNLRFTRVIAVDDRFMFTVTDTAANLGTEPVTITPFASVQRQGLPSGAGKSSAHEGAVGVLDGQLRLEKYQPLKKKAQESFPSKGGWVGLTDKYWLAALSPAGAQPISGQYRVVTVNGVDVYETNFHGGGVTIAPGLQTTQTTHLYAGAKVVPVLQDYGKKLGIARFDDAVDWGWLYFISKPIFWTIEFFYRLVGNFGVAILLMTVAVKILFFYPANLSYASMTKMKKIQPQLEVLKVKNKNDPAKQQQDMMALYAQEKINPLMGCLPMLATIPVFLGLFKVLNVTIEMRHAPFFGWVQDLSARDPLTVLNLFGAIPWDPAHTPLIGGFLDQYLHLGPWVIAYGVTMWLTTSMNPPAGDPMQQRIFQWMPVVFSFTLAQFAVGLLIYYTWSNLLTIVQQYVIMRRFKVDNPIDDIIARFRGKPQAAK